MGIADISTLKPGDEPESEKLYIITLGRGRPPKSQCTCGWKTEPSENMILLAQAAVEHSAQTGHVMRKHEGIG